MCRFISKIKIEIFDIIFGYLLFKKNIVFLTGFPVLDRQFPDKGFVKRNSS